MTKVHAVETEVAIEDILPGAQFADAYSLTVDDPALDARAAAERMLGHSPPWVDGLMAMRDAVVSPFGLKTSARQKMSDIDKVGIFPVVSETADRLVGGFDDKHLDFRVVIDVVSEANGRRVTATTVVRTHNPLGRVYLAIILPFHRVIVRAMLEQLRI